MFKYSGAPKRSGRISPSEVKQLLAGSQPLYLIDVRTPEEYIEAHIPGSILLPLNKINTGISKLVDDRNARIIVYCRSGARAEKACAALGAMGYTNVSSLGGIVDWPYETAGGRG
jgi:phage shock protein E